MFRNNKMFKLDAICLTVQILMTFLICHKSICHIVSITSQINKCPKKKSIFVTQKVSDPTNFSKKKLEFLRDEETNQDQKCDYFVMLVVLYILFEPKFLSKYKKSKK